MTEYIEIAKSIIEYPPVWVASLAFSVTQVVKMASKQHLLSVNPFYIRATSLIAGTVFGAILLDLQVLKAAVAGLAIGGAVFVCFDAITMALCWILSKERSWMERHK